MISFFRFLHILEFYMVIATFLGDGGSLYITCALRRLIYVKQQKNAALAQKMLRDRAGKCSASATTLDYVEHWRGCARQISMEFHWNPTDFH